MVYVHQGFTEYTPPLLLMYDWIAPLANIAYQAKVFAHELEDVDNSYAHEVILNLAEIFWNATTSDRSSSRTVALMAKALCNSLEADYSFMLADGFALALENIAVESFKNAWKAACEPIVYSTGRKTSLKPVPAESDPINASAFLGDLFSFTMITAASFIECTNSIVNQFTGIEHIYLLLQNMWWPACKDLRIQPYHYIKWADAIRNRLHVMGGLQEKCKTELTISTFIGKLVWEWETATNVMDGSAPTSDSRSLRDCQDECIMCAQIFTKAICRAKAKQQRSEPMITEPWPEELDILLLDVNWQDNDLDEASDLVDDFEWEHLEKYTNDVVTFNESL
ncbi:hypothetical protein FA15DRAFT_717087 [Coprinopsis marcescibilis]|uniref:Uncharacterized protein n=1 Tax=Coprinopsis marcescibilis TaxID=230819 RepID=A0A5C3KN02_COPMA|nr:hypothetical protein FA15DRAFT_717087 [Coprinopsis marcescibilis]